MTEINNIDSTYFNYFNPLINKFVNNYNLYAPKIDGVPGLSLPLFRKGYGSSHLRLVFVGIDDANTFLDLKGYFCDPDPLRTALTQFQNKFKLNQKSIFWKFIIKLLSSLHNLNKDWSEMTDEEKFYIFSDFAWSNVFPIAFYKNRAKRLNILKNYWDSVSKAGEELFFGFKHILNTLNPNVAVIMYKNCSILNYIERDYPGDLKKVDECVKEGKFLTHYLLERQEGNVNIFHVPHPRYMRRLKDLKGEEFFCNKLTELINGCVSQTQVIYHNDINIV